MYPSTIVYPLCVPSEAQRRQVEEEGKAVALRGLMKGFDLKQYGVGFKVLGFQGMGARV